MSSITAPTRFIETRLERYAYRRFGGGPAPPLVFLQHFTGTLDNWDPAVTDPLARGREVVLRERGRGALEWRGAPHDRRHGRPPPRLRGRSGSLGSDLLGFSLGGMVAQQIAVGRPALVRKMLLVGSAPEGGEDIMHLEKPELSKILADPTLSGPQVLVRLFFTPSESSQAAGEAFVARIAARTEDREPISGPKVAQAQMAAFRSWERVDGERFGMLRRIAQPCLVVNGMKDMMIPVRNSYLMAEHLPNAVLLTYPDAGHGSLFQFHESFVRQAALFLDKLPGQRA